MNAFPSDGWWVTMPRVRKPCWRNSSGQCTGDCTSECDSHSAVSENPGGQDTP